MDVHTWRGRFYAHLVAPDVALLHAFARELPCKRRWFHNKPGLPHYDLYGICIDCALDRGAELVSTRELIVQARVWYLK